MSFEDHQIETRSMNLDSVRELKTALGATMVGSVQPEMAGFAGTTMPAQPLAAVATTPPSLALGVTRKGKREYALAVRVQRRGMETGPHIDAIRKQAKGEVDVRYIGRVVKRAGPPWYRRRTRPLKPGLSIGHFRVTAGTLGAFVRDRKSGATMLLSNNHVLANENRARRGDPILQPGAFDGGTRDADRVGRLARSVKLRKDVPNLLDAAVAHLDEGIKFNARTLTGLGRLAGLGDEFLDEGAAVSKLGRTTGATGGKVLTFELDYLIVHFDLGYLQFDGQVEIEGAGADPFSLGGDSGALVVDDARKAVALLFAGSDQGGSNGQGFTYATPIRKVLDALAVDLIAS
jgi:hypothetical protein